ncbi:MAG: hypothetical protein AMJ79_04650 [Phycisphaerae bacterium SM23_30]|nr:MAG: hypothetical protein AMJ79_04650 [Phycisphaerae bacterium SM23_30]
MLPQELIRQIRRIQIYTNRAVNEVYAGEYESTFKGRGMQFDEVREYTPGDEVRSIDWNVTARMGKPYIKRFVEERELTVVLLVDMSASGSFGTIGKLKNELAAELCAVLSFSAIKNNDKVGLITFSDRIERFIPPKKGTQHVLRVIRELLYGTPPRRQTDIPMALDYLGKVIKKKATVFLVSDFMAADARRSLRLVNKRHDLIAVVVRDRREVSLPALGLIELEDAETGEAMLIDTSSRKARRQYEGRTSDQRDELENILRSVNVDCINIASDRPYLQELIRFFRMREKRR